MSEDKNYEDMSHGARIAEKVFIWSAYSDQTKDLKPSEIKEILTPIFGDEIIKEVMDYFKKPAK